MFQRREPPPPSCTNRGYRSHRHQPPPPAGAEAAQLNGQRDSDSPGQAAGAAPGVLPARSSPRRDPGDRSGGGGGRCWGPRFPLRGSRAPGAPCLGGAARLRGSGSLAALPPGGTGRSWARRTRGAVSEEAAAARPGSLLLPQPPPAAIFPPPPHPHRRPLAEARPERRQRGAEAQGRPWPLRRGPSAAGPRAGAGGRHLGGRRGGRGLPAAAWGAGTAPYPGGGPRRHHPGPTAASGLPSPRLEPPRAPRGPGAAVGAGPGNQCPGVKRPRQGSRSPQELLPWGGEAACARGTCQVLFPTRLPWRGFKDDLEAFILRERCSPSGHQKGSHVLWEQLGRPKRSSVSRMG
ncbi:collagen alpha-1(III) chain-like [Falco peregrinus]|uniref:collagen alpha-1(III) chain-like n=1 Tax=Falco peregrinus TaxID=8954 RepID=UPI002479C3C9|nr:collagen alpha-1(III) chain-like [Falco peregrinus]